MIDLIFFKFWKKTCYIAWLILKLSAVNFFRARVTMKIKVVWFYDQITTHTFYSFAFKHYGWKHMTGILFNSIGKICACVKNFHYAWCEPFRAPVLSQSKFIHLWTCVPTCDFRYKYRNTLFGLCSKRIISQIIFAKSVGV